MRAALLAVAMALSSAGACAQAPAWVMDPGSELRFTAAFEGAPAPGVFAKFDVSVRFDPERLAGSRVDVVVSTPSADMGSDPINQAIRGADWFDVARFPVAEFHAAEVRGRPQGGYVAVGMLTVKGIAKPIEVPFSWTQPGDTATMRGELTIDRGAYGIGVGEWRSTRQIGAEVRVGFVVRLRRSG